MGRRTEHEGGSASVDPPRCANPICRLELGNEHVVLIAGARARHFCSIGCVVDAIGFAAEEWKPQRVGLEQIDDEVVGYFYDSRETFPHDGRMPVEDDVRSKPDLEFEEFHRRLRLEAEGIDPDDPDDEEAGYREGCSECDAERERERERRIRDFCGDEE
jgi:hypothetical protein